MDDDDAMLSQLPGADLREEVDSRRAIVAGRIDILFRLGRHYLFLPFAALCVAATLMRPGDHAISDHSIWVASTPLLLQILLTIAAERLAHAYAARPKGDDPLKWARRYTVLSGISGAIWGAGALLWFVPHSFPAQAYLSLAFLGIIATEFIARSAYRPAFLALASLALVPLAGRLLLEGEAYATMSSILVLFFGGVLYSYCDRFTALLDESIRLRYANAGLIVDLSREKQEAELARDTAEASTRAKTAFVANISHEIRTPLNALLGMAQLLERSELDRAQRSHVQVVLEAGRGLKTLLDDVIALSRDDGLSDHSDEDCDAAEAVRTVGRLLQPRAWEKQIRLKVSAPPNLPRVQGDPRRVRQVLLKLADNALKFTDRGSVEITVEAFEAESGGQMLRFFVRDTGLGLMPEAAERLFEPFSPGDTSYARHHDGAGLGLAVAKRTVESLGGQIGFEGAPGEGATFWFTVPAVASATSANAGASAPIAASAPPPSGLTFLLALSEPLLRSQIGDLLEPFGNRLVYAHNITDAIGLAGRGAFDAILVNSADADMMAASPGVTAPILAVVTSGMRLPVAVSDTLRWPATAASLYVTLSDLLGRAADATLQSSESDRAAAIDAPAFAALEKSLGLKTLIEILQSYLKTAEELSSHLEAAGSSGNWDEATRFAQDIAGAAGGLGLTALTHAARAFTQKVRQGENADELNSAVEAVVAEHTRVRRVLANLYPDLAA